jgi:hypothetical protein
MKALQWMFLSGWLAVFLMLSATSPVNADVVCMNTKVIAEGNEISVDIQLVGRSLVWFKTSGDLFHYNLETTATHQIGTIQTSYGNYLAVDNDHVVWIDPTHHIQLYDINSGMTTQLTSSEGLRVDPSVEGQYVVWREGKTPSRKLMVYNLVTKTTTLLAKLEPYGNYYSLNQGRVLADGTLYDLASGTTTYLGDEGYWQLKGNYVLGVVKGYALQLKNLATDSSVTLWKYNLEAHRIGLADYVLGDDYVVYSLDTSGIGTVYYYGYQISTGRHWFRDADDFAFDSEILVSGRFAAFVDYTTSGWLFHIYDLITDSNTPLRHHPAASSNFGALDQNRVAWVEQQRDINGEILAVQVILRTDCGATPKITHFIPNINVLTGRHATLSVITVGDEPMTRQWYQGLPGDTTRPVGSSPTFETPPLVDTTSYWVRVINPFGSVDSEALTVTPGETAELVRDGGFEQEWSKTWERRGWYFQFCFKPQHVHSGECSLRFWPYRTLREKHKVLQQFPTVLYLPGDTLTLSAWIKAKKILADGVRLALKVRYEDGTKDKAVVRTVQHQFAYTQFTAEPLVIDGNVADAKIVIKYSSAKGKWWLDDVSVLHQPSVENMVIPLPAD